MDRLTVAPETRMGSAPGTIRAPSPRTVRLIGGFAAAVLLGVTVAGATFIVTGLAANTAFKWLRYGHDSVRPMLEHEWPAWVELGLLPGGLFGALGWGRATRARLRPA